MNLESIRARIVPGVRIRIWDGSTRTVEEVTDNGKARMVEGSVEDLRNVVRYIASGSWSFVEEDGAPPVDYLKDKIRVAAHPRHGYEINNGKFSMLLDRANLTKLRDALTAALSPEVEGR